MLDITLINQLRTHNPLIHCITNIVAANFVANGLLAIGASPLMSDCAEEMADLATLTQGLSVNIGTLCEDKWQAVCLACSHYNQHQKPILLDPVGVGATQFRQQKINYLLEHYHFTAIRGNAAELAYLAGINWQPKGVDVGEGQQDPILIAQKVATKYHTTVLLSGATDIITDGSQTITVTGGSPFLPKITATGCLQGAVLTAFLACCNHPLRALTTASAFYKIAAEKAEQRTLLQAGSNGTFLMAFLDALAQPHLDYIKNHVQIKEIK
ncbi:hydroxyethylthiazole kinase [Actinobacillus delphinicola]|uniref:Hydroxyethylthiazole kinase n=1 Tax=Actinobacillus delphinicola TaxID=51161 RepID=A0A448TVB1_9PAST|nr:hydroxyethylthiazole kinase [Actinobacillus delphinicola]VEJ09863.1 hydroxyethylthiazole kinase [Actinobacillus delphinicola]